jgi:DNA (cytosine-5)-methyltransferase 1
MPSFYEFFAGGGMARAGLGPEWTCLFANDFDFKKSAAYNLNWGGGVLKTADIRQIEAADLPGYADLAWASFPCQDLSLAGGGAGLKGERSGTFWPFWDVMNGLIAGNRAPKIIVVENVCGAITSHNGKDFAAICATFARAGYRFGALVMDAKHFLPQSRPRLFIAGVRSDLTLPEGITAQEPSDLWHTRALRTAHAALPPKTRASWLWWTLPKPPKRRARFADLIENNPKNVAWHTPAQTDALLAMMSEVNRAKVEAAQKTGKRMVGGVYRRTRHDAFGRKIQRAEVRFDDIAGCLRTPAGGSSRQTIIVVEGPEVRTRLISPRETARLMGLPDTYKLPDNYNEAYHLTGDGLAVPVVHHLSRHIFSPIIALATEGQKRAAA